MREQEFDLAVGDVVQVGDHRVTVVEIENDNVVFRIEEVLEDELLLESTRWAYSPR